MNCVERFYTKFSDMQLRPVAPTVNKLARTWWTHITNQS